MKIGGIILAGGNGSRFGSAIPKQFLELRGKSILEYSIDKFKEVAHHIVIVSNKGWMEETRKLVSGPSIEVTGGGITRQISVYNGLKCLADKDIEIAAIHDGVRPLFSLSLLRKCIQHALQYGSAVPAVKVCGTLVLSDEGEKISGYIDRDKAYEIQTPQVFKFGLIFQAHIKAMESGMTDFTDDSRLFEMNGMPADIIEGDDCNIKITTPFDLVMVEEYLRGMDGKYYQEHGGRRICKNC